MPLKIFILSLKDKDTSLSNKRKVEHMLIKYSGIKISLGNAINIITAVSVGKEMEVLFNSDRFEEIETAFQKWSVVVAPKVKV